MTSTDVDVVVGGGGHNGLVAGCVLARAGWDVVVLEKENLLGGMALSAPLLPQAPRHIPSPGAYEDVYLRASGIAEDLRLADHGYREVDAVGWAWLGPDGESLLFAPDVATTVAQIARFSRADAARYGELVGHGLRLVELQGLWSTRSPARPGVRTLAAAARALVPDRRLRCVFAELVTGTAADTIAATFDSPQMRGAFASMVAHGGRVRTGTRVVTVQVGSGRARGVTLASGETIGARRGVLTAIAPQRVPDLVGDALDRGLAERIRAAPANAAGVATLTVSLALRGRLEVPSHQPSATVDLRRPTLFTGSYEGVLDACRACARGDVPVPASWWAAIFTAMDPTQAPPGEDVAQVYTPAPVAPREGWATARGPATDALLAAAATTISGLDELEIGRHVESPDDLSRRTGTSRGSLYHVDHVPTRMGPLRPAWGAGGHATALKGLVLSGAGTHPGGGVSGLPGRLAAERLLRSRG